MDSVKQIAVNGTTLILAGLVLYMVINYLENREANSIQYIPINNK